MEQRDSALRPLDPPAFSLAYINPTRPTAPLVASSSSSSSRRDSPSPPKKRRIGSVQPSFPRSASTPTFPTTSQRRPPTRLTKEQQAQNQREEAERDIQRRESINRLKSAWSDVEHRHSTLSFLPPTNFSTGNSRALRVQDDDVIDLITMEVVEDRGVLRGLRPGAFTFGGRFAESEDEDEDEDEEEAGWSEEEENGPSKRYMGGRTRARRKGRRSDDSGSEDELAAPNELPSLPSQRFREQRRQEGERRSDLLEFVRMESEARKMRGDSNDLGVDDEEWEANRARLEREGGNELLEAPIAGDQAESDEEDELASFEVTEVEPWRPSPIVSPPRSRIANTAPPPSTTQQLRNRLSGVKLLSSSPLAGEPITASSSSPAARPPRRSYAPTSSSPLKPTTSSSPPRASKQAPLPLPRPPPFTRSQSVMPTNVASPLHPRFSSPGPGSIRRHTFSLVIPTRQARSSTPHPRGNAPPSPESSPPPLSREQIKRRTKSLSPVKRVQRAQTAGPTWTPPARRDGARLPFALSTRREEEAEVEMEEEMLPPPPPHQLATPPVSKTSCLGAEEDVEEEDLDAEDESDDELLLTPDVTRSYSVAPPSMMLMRSASRMPVEKREETVDPGTEEEQVVVEEEESEDELDLLRA